jgi:hypothetical protein
MLFATCVGPVIKLPEYCLDKCMANHMAASVPWTSHNGAHLRMYTSRCYVGLRLVGFVYVTMHLVPSGRSWSYVYVTLRYVTLVYASIPFGMFCLLVRYVKNVQIKIHRAIILPVFCVGARVDLSP